MKRILAAVLLLCCLLLILPTALAEPVPEEEEAAAEVLPEEEEEESSIRESDGPKPKTEESTLQESEGPVEETPVEEVDPLEGVTAFKRIEITAIVDESGRAIVTQTIKMNVVGVLEDITFAFPGTARDREIAGWRAKSSAEDGLRYLTVHNKAGFSGEQTFTLSYSVKDLVSAGEESQKLELPLLVQQKYPVGVVALAVNLPKTFASMPVFSSGYYGDLVEDYMTINTSATAVTATVNDILQDSDSLTMSLTVQEGYFSGRFGTGGGSSFLRVSAIVLAVLSLLFWWRGIKGSAILSPSRTLPPDGVNPGDLPFLLSGGKADFNMLVSHWANLGYLSLYANKSGHVILRRRMPMGNERRKFEQRLFDLLFGDGDVCDGASIRYQKVGRKAQEVIPRYWNRRLFDKSGLSPALVRGMSHLACGFATAAAMDVVAPAKVHGLFVIVGLVAGCALSVLLRGSFGSFYLSDWVKTGLGAGCGLLLLILGGLGEVTVIMVPAVAVSAFLAWRTVHGGRPSSYGQQVLSQTLGFRKFLRNANATHLLQMLQRDPQYFYKMLPYAQAMGLGNSFVNAFQDVRLEPCQWYESARGVPATAGAFYDRYLDALDMLNISIDER